MKNLIQTRFSAFPKNKYAIALLGMFMMCLHVGAQDMHFSQFGSAPLLLNPALVGDFHGNFRMTTNYKNQWMGTLNAYQTYALSGEFSFYEDKQNGYTGVGISAFRDVAGDVQLAQTQLGIVAAHHLPLNEHQYLGGGISLSYASKSIDPSKFEWQNQYDGAGFNSNLSSGETMRFERASYVDFGFGFSWNYEDPVRKIQYRAGFSAMHLNKPKQQVYGEIDRMFSRLGLHYDMYIPLENKSRAVVPSLAFFSQGPHKEFIVGAQYHLAYGMSSKYTGELTPSAFIMGAYYRAGDALIPMIGFHYQRSVEVLMSYDVNVSRLSPATQSRGGLELSVIFMGFTKSKALVKVVKRS